MGIKGTVSGFAPAASRLPPDFSEQSREGESPCPPDLPPTDRFAVVFPRRGKMGPTPPSHSLRRSLN